LLQALSFYTSPLSIYPLSPQPTFGDAWRGKGAALSLLGRHDESIAATSKALELQPDDFKAWSNKGKACMELSRNEEALRAFERASELRPDDQNALMGRLSVLDRMIVQDPDNLEYWIRKARGSLEIGS